MLTSYRHRLDPSNRNEERMGGKKENNLCTFDDIINSIIKFLFLMVFLLLETLLHCYIVLLQFVTLASSSRIFSIFLYSKGFLKMYSL